MRNSFKCLREIFKLNSLTHRYIEFVFYVNTNLVLRLEFNTTK